MINLTGVSGDNLLVGEIGDDLLSLGDRQIFSTRSNHKNFLLLENNNNKQTIQASETKDNLTTDPVDLTQLQNDFELIEIKIGDRPDYNSSLLTSNIDTEQNAENETESNEEALILEAENFSIYNDGERVTQQLETGENPAFDLVGLTQLKNDPQFAGIDGSGFSVAVIDTGINYNHPSLAPNYITGYDFVNEDNDPLDDAGHGTHVAGTVGAADDTIGVAPDAGIIGLKVLGADGSGNFNDIHQSLQWVLDNHEEYNIVAVNMSLGGGFYSSENELTGDLSIGIDLVNRLEDEGIVVVSATGNSYEENQTLNAGAPAIYSTLAVGAVWQDDVTDSYTRFFSQTPGADKVVYFSQRLDTGSFLLAPGAEITSTSINGGLEDLRGTSMASPHVAGAVALLQEAAVQFGGRQLTADEVVDILISTADTVVDGDDEDDNVNNTGLSFPRMNIYNAVAEVKRRSDGIAPPPPPDEEDPPEEPLSGDPNGTIAGAFIGPTLDGEPVNAINGIIGIDGNGTRVGDKDVDIFRFEVESSGLVTIELGTRTDDPDDFDTYLRLFDENGVEITFNDDIVSGVERFSRIEQQLEPGTYYAGVSGYNNGSYDPNVAGSGVSADTGNYSIQFDLSNNDPNGLVSGAIDVLLGNDLEPLVFNGRIGADYGEPVGTSDVDLYRVVVPDDGVLFIDIDTPYAEGEYVDSFLRLFDEEGEELFFAGTSDPFESDDEVGFDKQGNPVEFLVENEIVLEQPGQTELINGSFDEDGNYVKGNYGHRTDSFLGVIVERGDVYHIGVSDYFNSDYDPQNLNNRPQTGDGGRYELIATFVNNDVNGSITQINSLTNLPLNSEENIGRDGLAEVGDRDVDFWKFNSAEAGILEIDIDSDEVDSVALLFDSQGRLLAKNDDTDGQDPLLQYQIQTDTDYFVAITGFGNQNFDPFALGSGAGGDTGTYTINASLLSSDRFNSLSDNSLNSELVQDIGLDSVVAADVGEDNGFFIGGEDIDLYRFTPETNSTVEIRVGANEEFSADTYLRLFDSQGNEIAANDDESNLTKGSFLEQEVTANTEYIIGVNGSSDSAGNYNPLTGEGAAPGSQGGYTLTINETETETEQPIDQTELGTISEDTELTGDLSAINFGDIYYFTLDESQNINLSLSGTSEGTDNVLGAAIYRDANQDNIPDEEEQIELISLVDFSQTTSTGSLDLNAGDYIVNLVITGESATTYEATLDFDSTTNPPQDEIEQTELETISADTEVTGDLSATNFGDIYFFTLDESQNIDLSLSGTSEGTDNVLGAAIYRDANQDNIPDEEEQIELIALTDFNETVSTGSLDLDSGDYILSLIITGESATTYEATLDFADSESPTDDVLDTDIFRFQNTSVPGTYLYAAAEEAQNIRDNFDNFDEEGLAFKVAVEPGDDLIPLYRFQSNVNPGTYLFAGESERNGINDNFAEQFTEEGIAFYVYGAGEDKGTPFTRFQNSNLPGTYLFAGPEEAANIEANFPNFDREGIAFEVGT